MGFTKLDNGIITSSIWSEKYHTRILWITMLAMCNMDGFVSTSKSGLKRSANITDDEFEESIKCLESPDPESRSSNDDGRRVYKVEGGWQIINHFKYRKKQYVNDRFDDNYSKRGYVYFAKTNDNKIKIGHSVNPWARIRELKTAAPDAELILVIDGTYEDEKNFQNRFIHLHISREWFKYDSDLKEFILSNSNSSKNVATKVDTNYVSVSASVSISEKENRKIVPPKIEWVVEYCNERKNNVIPQKWYDFYQSKNWMIGKNKMKDWQAAVRTWEQNEQSQQPVKKDKPKTSSNWTY